MTETYPIQREILNDVDTPIGVVKDEWPFLFEVPHLFDRASKLLGFSVQNKLAQVCCYCYYYDCAVLLHMERILCLYYSINQKRFATKKRVETKKDKLATKKRMINQIE